MIGYGLLGYIGCLFLKYKDDIIEIIEFFKWLLIFRDFLMGLFIVMLILFYIVILKVG